MNGIKGYILISRKIVESKIWDKPPLYIKLWIWLLTQSNYSEHNGLERGQILTSYKEMQEALSWHIGFRKEVPRKDEIAKILRFMSLPIDEDTKATTKATMIATTKATKGVLITICNYNDYQDSKFYESNDESNHESNHERNSTYYTKTKTKTNKNKNRAFTPPTLEEVSVYCDSRKNNVDPEAFIDFYEAKGWMIGKNKMKDWKAAVRTWERKRNEKHTGLDRDTEPKRTGIDWNSFTDLRTE